MGQFLKIFGWIDFVKNVLKKRTLSIINQTDSSFRRCSVTFEKSNSRSTLYFCVYLNYNLVSSIFRYLGGEGNWLGLGAPSRDPQGVGRLFWNPLCGNRWLIVPFFFFHLSCWERPIKIQSLFFWWSTTTLYMDLLIMAPNHDNDLPNWNMDYIKIFAYRNETL